jgi:succinate dehydrogenase/fumarate reductase cytochrome b subunit
MPGKLLIVAALVAIVYNLGAGLYYMIADHGRSDRMLHALMRRIALSVLLILAIIAAIGFGWIQPHGVGG